MEKSTTTRNQRAGRKKQKKPVQVQASRGQKRKRKRNFALYYLLLLIVLLCAGAVLAVTVWFKIEKIEVFGTDKYAPDDIIATTGIVEGENLLRISAADIQKRLLEQYPYLETVEVRRKIPPGVELRLTQCTPAAALIQGERVTLITREGKVLEQGKLLVPPGVPVVKGIDVGSEKPGEYLGEEYKEKLDMLNYLNQALLETDFGEITNVDITDRLNMKIVYENRLILELGTEMELPYKLKFIKEVMETKIEPDAQGVLDASNAKENRVVFKPQALESQPETPEDEVSAGNTELTEENTALPAENTDKP